MQADTSAHSSADIQIQKISRSLDDECHVSLQFCAVHHARERARVPLVPSLLEATHVAIWAGSCLDSSNLSDLTGCEDGVCLRDGDLLGVSAPEVRAGDAQRNMRRAEI